MDPPYRNRRQRRHVYLFRHCIRSTSDKVDNVDSTETSTPLSDYTSHPLPDWQSTESMDCTRRGLKVMEGEGQHIARELLEEMSEGSGSNSNKKKIRLKFISDVAKRDSDTTLALVRGFYDVFERGTIDLSVTYDQDLFKPLVARRTSFGLKKFVEYNATSLCEERYSSDTIHQEELERRLSTLVKPEGDLLKILQVLKKVTGSDAWLQGDEPDKIWISDDGEVMGKINVLRVITQAAFYAKASNMKPDFLPQMTPELLYHLLEWTWWFQALTEMGTTKPNIEGSLLAASILQTLRQDNVNGEDDEVLTVYIYVGHDTDISRIASIFGLRFNLQPPYYTSPKASGLYAPAPPGSAMHFVHDVSAATVEMSFQYPILISKDGRVKWDGKLETIGMKKRNNPTEALLPDDLTRRRLTIFGGPDKDTTGIALLEKRILNNLAQYEGAPECFERADQLQSWPHMASRMSVTRSNPTNIDISEPTFGSISAAMHLERAEYPRLVYAFGLLVPSICLVIVLLIKKWLWPSAAERANANKKKQHRRITSGDGGVVQKAQQHRRITSGGGSVVDYDQIELNPTHSD